MKNNHMDMLINLQLSTKGLVKRVADAIFIVASFIIAMYLRVDSFDFLDKSETALLLILLTTTTLVIFEQSGIYHTIFRYVSSAALRSIGIAVSLSAISLALFAWLLTAFMPRSVPCIYALLAFLIITGSRYLTRYLVSRRQASHRTPVIIYGAGQSGRQLAGSLREGTDFAPVAFIDDDPLTHGKAIGGLKVHPGEMLAELAAEHGAKIVLLAMPSISVQRRAAILKRLETTPLHVQTIPSMADIVAGRARWNEIAEIPTEDLLGRETVPPLENLLAASLDGQRVMVTGAGGSIGSELCRQIMRFTPSHLIMVDVSEFALYSIDHELQAIAAPGSVNLISALGSVRDSERMETLMRQHKVTSVFHAAAYKHVPLVEANAVEGIRNNVFGTETVLRAALNCGVKNFTLVSTDKAVRPTNIMGASKRLAELVCQAHAHDEHGETRIAMVRFGNVLGSSGSVIPLFRKQIAAGGPITVTDPEVTRYFMTIPEAAQLVIQASAIAQGGDVFLLDMGEPVRIVDLAVRMARLSGYQPLVHGAGGVSADDPRPPIEVAFTKLRPGEKLYEELLVSAQAQPTAHPRIMRATEDSLCLPDLDALLERLQQACAAEDLASIRGLLIEGQTGYRTPSPHPDCRDGAAVRPRESSTRTLAPS